MDVSCRLGCAVTAIAMPLPLFCSSAWIIDVHGEDVRLELTFRDGTAFEVGLPVGTYEHVGTSFIAAIGEHVRLIVDLASGSLDTLAARLLTHRDGVETDEMAFLSRVAWN